MSKVNSKLGPYEIVSRLGEGGMGIVYRARDSRPDREVAIKISAEHFSDRFEREARTIASLNHPNICTLYDVGPNYLVMELVEGETLAERIQVAFVSCARHNALLTRCKPTRALRQSGSPVLPLSPGRAERHGFWFSHDE